MGGQFTKLVDRASLRPPGESRGPGGTRYPLTTLTYTAPDPSEKRMSYFLGIDASTQSVSGVVIDSSGGQIVWEHAVSFDNDLPHYKTKGGALSHADGVVCSPPLMWVEALEKLMGQLATADIDVSKIAAVSGSGQQHGSVYLAPGFADALHQNDPARPLHEQLAPWFTRPLSPIWMDTSTQSECREIDAACGGPEVLHRISGSPATLRFTGPQIRKFYKTDPAAYAKTRTIHLVSGFCCSLLLGRIAPLDHADASGMNLFDLNHLRWHPPFLDATAPGLVQKLPDTVGSDTAVGTIAPRWVERVGFHPDCKVVVFSGDNPCSLVGLGLTGPERSAISLGTSDTLFGLSDSADVPEGAEGHLFASPLGGGVMNLICFMNGSLARENLRERYQLDWKGFERAVAEAPPGNRGRLMLPYFLEEITPPSRCAQVYRFGLNETDVPANCRALFEAQMLSQRRHTRHLSRPEYLHVTGGASRNDTLLQIMADVFGATVHRLSTGAGAGLGAALRAYQAHSGQDWNEVYSAFVRLEPKSFVPDPISHSRYTDLIEIYAACEDFALNGGPDPEHQRLEFARRWS